MGLFRGSQPVRALWASCAGAIMSRGGCRPAPGPRRAPPSRPRCDWSWRVRRGGPRAGPAARVGPVDLSCTPKSSWRWRPETGFPGSG